MDEQAAIKLLKEGDLQGLETLIQLYYFRAVKAAYLIIQDRPQAEDIVQEAYLHACEKIHQLESDRFGPWFLRSVINASLKAARKQKSQLSLSAEAGAESPSLEDLLADDQPSPETSIEMDELTQQIWQALQHLTAEQRVAVVLKYYLEMSESEVSVHLNRPLSTVKWRLFTARQRLKKILSPNFDPQTPNPGRASRTPGKQD
jgi:RNA polymerase sigma-70 factor (ECF subfamily)